MRRAEFCPAGIHRWTLRREWAPGQPIGWAMLNPSRADHQREDPTLRRVIDFTRAWGFGRLVVVNLFSRCTPSPAELAEWWATPAPTLYGTWQENRARAADALAPCAFVVAAWGCVAPQLARMTPAWLEGVDPHHSTLDWRCLGRTAGGHPIHPLARGRHRVPDGTEAVPFDPWSGGSPA